MRIDQKLLNSWRYSIAGLRHAWSTETSIKYEFFMLAVAVVLLLLVRPGALWSVLLIAALLFLIALELLNSAVEKAFDLYSAEYHDLIKYGKDMASAAILLAIAANGLLWLGMLIDRYL